MRSEGKTAREIADQLGITEGTVNGQINYYPDLFSKVYSCYDQEKLIKLWKAGVAANIIAKELGISRGTVTSFVSAHREICEKRKTKYTVPKLYNMHKANMSIKKIAKQVGISEETVEYFIQSYQDEHPEEVSEYEAEIMRLWDEDRKNTYKVIAKKLGINPSEVLSVLRKHNQSRVKRRNAYDPNDIVKLWSKKLTTAKIAEKLGIPKTTVSKFASKHRDLCPRRD